MGLRGPKPSTHCRRGHDLAVVGTYKSGDRRACRKCFLDWTKGPKGRAWRKNNAHKIREYQRKSRVRRASAIRDDRLQRRFGISIEEYTDLLNRQNGVCAICGKRETATLRGKPMNLAVDHDHGIGGKVRGLLCKACNGGLGIFEDDEIRMEAAIAYLRKARA